jgi:hypothetical protein
METELTDELLDLEVEERGYRNALYAVNVTPDGGEGCSSSTGSSSSLTCCKLCW